MNKPDAKEVAGILLDGARRLCDYAEEQWISGKYGDDHAAKMDNLRHWADIRRSLPTKKELTQLLIARDEQKKGTNDVD